MAAPSISSTWYRSRSNSLARLADLHRGPRARYRADRSPPEFRATVVARRPRARRRSDRASVVVLRSTGATDARADHAGRHAPGPVPASSAAVARWPSTYARLLPSAGIVLARTNSSSPTANLPSTRASCAPSRTIDASTRPPIRSSSASTTSVLPAPVSPVIAVIPPGTRVRAP